MPTTKLRGGVSVELKAVPLFLKAVPLLCPSQVNVNALVLIRYRF